MSRQVTLPQDERVSRAVILFPLWEEASYFFYIHVIDIWVILGDAHMKFGYWF